MSFNPYHVIIFVLVDIIKVKNHTRIQSYPCRFCGNSAGLATKKEALGDGTNTGTICSKLTLSNKIPHAKETYLEIFYNMNNL